MRYDKNEDFFKIWNEDMAYVLGFVTADGCVSDRNVLIIGIHQNDIEILEYIKRVMKSDNPIGLSDRRNRLMAVLNMTSSRICGDLLTLNIGPRKTYDVVAPPFIPDNMVSHYIRGLFDGDGSIYLSNRHKQLIAEVTIATASPMYARQISRLLTDNDINNHVYEKLDGRDKHVPIYKVSMGGKDVIDFSEFIYRDAQFYLKRKYDKFQQFYNGRFIRCLACNTTFFRQVITQDFCSKCHDLLADHNTVELESITHISSEIIRRATRNQFKDILRRRVVEDMIRTSTRVEENIEAVET